MYWTYDMCKWTWKLRVCAIHGKGAMKIQSVLMREKKLCNLRNWVNLKDTNALWPAEILLTKCQSKKMFTQSRLIVKLYELPILYTKYDINTYKAKRNRLEYLNCMHYYCRIYWKNDDWRNEYLLWGKYINLW